MLDDLAAPPPALTDQFDAVGRLDVK